ncbi:tetratricopeptide repeat protein [Brachyspira pulli]|uniref:tetratricopeptide repeat protein n=1 Tax=Brachyspira pulli TaxID=310721 RepID=UPI0030058DC0
MRKYNINNKPFDFPENLNEFQENSTKNNIKISYKENRYKASEKILNEDELIEILKNNDCLFGNSAFIHLCKEKYQIIEEVYNIKLDHLQKSFIIKNDIKSIRTTLHKPFYKEVLNYYQGDEKEILYSYYHFIILEEICRLEEEGKTKEEIKKIIFDTEALSKKEKEYFDIGVEKYNAKDFRNAVNYFNNCLEVNKENIEAYKYIAESYLNLENYDKALENFNKYIESNTNDDEIYNLIGICFYRKENYNESIEYFSKCIELNDNNSLYYYNRATAKFGNKKFESSIDDFNKCLELNIKDPQKIYFYIAKSNYELNQYEKFAKNLNKAIELNFDNEELNFYKGFLNYKKDNFNEAKEYFNKSIKLEYNTEKCYLYIGIINYKEKNFQEALKYLNDCIKINSNNLEAYFYIAKSNYELNQYDEFAKNLNKAIELNFDDEELNFYRGFLNYKEGNFNEAKEYFNKSIESEYNTEKCYLYIGIINYKENSFQEALEYLNKIIQPNSNNDQAYYFRGSCYYELYKKDKADKKAGDINTIIDALEDFDEALKLNNQLGNAYAKRAEIKLYMSIENNDEKMKNEAKEDIFNALKYKTNLAEIITIFIELYYNDFKENNKNYIYKQDNQDNLSYLYKLLQYSTKFKQIHKTILDIVSYCFLSKTGYEKDLILLIKDIEDFNYDTAVYYFMMGNYEESYEYFKKCLNSDKLDEIYYNISVCLYRLNKYKDSIEYLAKALELDCNNYKYKNTMMLLLYKSISLEKDYIIEYADKYCCFDDNNYLYYFAYILRLYFDLKVGKISSKEELIKIFHQNKKIYSFVLAYFNSIYKYDYYEDNKYKLGTIDIIYNDYVYINKSIKGYDNRHDQPYIEDLYFYERAIELRKLNNISYNDLSLNRAKILFDLIEYEKSLEELKRLSSLSESYNDDFDYYSALYNFINNDYETSENHSEMYHHYLHVLSKIEEIKFNFYKDSGLFSYELERYIHYTSYFYNKYAMLDKTLEFYKNIIEYFNQNKDTYNFLYIFIAAIQLSLYEYTDDYEYIKEALKNIEYYQKNCEIRVHNDLFEKICLYDYSIYKLIGENYLKKSNYEKALNYFLIERYIYSIWNYGYYNNFNIAVCLCELEKFDEGIKYFEQYINQLQYSSYYNNDDDDWNVNNELCELYIIKYKYKKYLKYKNDDIKNDIFNSINKYKVYVNRFYYLSMYFKLKFEKNDKNIFYYSDLYSIFNSVIEDREKINDDVNDYILYDIYNDLINDDDIANDNNKLNRLSNMAYSLYKINNDENYKEASLKYFKQILDSNNIRFSKLTASDIQIEYCLNIIKEKFNSKLYNEVINFILTIDQIFYINNIINLFILKSYYELGEYDKIIKMNNNNAYLYLSYIKLEKFAEAYKISRDIDKEAFNDEYLIEKLRDIYKRGTYEQKSRVEKFCSNRNIEL